MPLTRIPACTTYPDILLDADSMRNEIICDFTVGKTSILQIDLCDQSFIEQLRQLGNMQIR
jgi:hypothetical protein